MIAYHCLPRANEGHNKGMICTMRRDNFHDLCTSPPKQIQELHVGSWWRHFSKGVPPKISHFGKDHQTRHNRHNLANHCHNGVRQWRSINKPMPENPENTIQTPQSDYHALQNDAASFLPFGKDFHTLRNTYHPISTTATWTHSPETTATTVKIFPHWEGYSYSRGISATVRPFTTSIGKLIAPYGQHIGKTLPPKPGKPFTLICTTLPVSVTRFSHVKSDSARYWRTTAKYSTKIWATIATLWATLTTIF